jgi:hypothetical protein
MIKQSDWGNMQLRARHSDPTAHDRFGRAFDTLQPEDTLCEIDRRRDRVSIARRL